ncbi:hypothetical protein BCR34DRAFT_600768 [Clohesyomyces aquaticus]|uniref:BTB domain-containing protein n=1 Tax=Clohesyomyces aquaticus TaxID=1231657 RepID=A0A1Y1ZPT0_9PLEO|nr:hypothetical protein BCR34DRAFT_600768 [Clohesyomyces aquaticus]
MNFTNTVPSFVYGGEMLTFQVGNPHAEFYVHHQVLHKATTFFTDLRKVHLKKVELESRVTKLRKLLLDYDNTRHVTCRISSDGDGRARLNRDTTIRDQLTEIIADDMMIDHIGTTADWVGVLAYQCGIKTTKEERRADARAELCTRIRESLRQLTAENKTYELTEMAGVLFVLMGQRVKKLDEEFQAKQPNLQHVEPETMEIFIHCLYTGRFELVKTDSTSTHLRLVQKFKLYDLAAILGADRIMELAASSFKTSISTMTDRQGIMDLLINQLHAVGSTRTEKLRDILMQKLQDFQANGANPSTPS